MTTGVITIWILDGYDDCGECHFTTGMWWGTKPSPSQIREALDGDMLPEELVGEAIDSLYNGLYWGSEHYNTEYRYNLFMQEVYKGEGEANK